MNDETKLKMRVLPGAYLVGVDIDADGCFEIEIEEVSRLERLGVAEICDQADVFDLTGDPDTDEQLLRELAASNGQTLEDLTTNPDDDDQTTDAEAPATDAPCVDVAVADATATDAPVPETPVPDAPATVAPADQATETPAAGKGKSFFGGKGKNK